MDAIISSALEEICSAGPGGVSLFSLWSRLSPSISLPLTPSVKQSVWTNLLAVPSLQFLDKSTNEIVSVTALQSLEDADKFNLAVVANESLRDCFVGVYDLNAREGFKGFNADTRNALQRLATARANGITQSQLAKEFGKGGNGIFYILRNLECQGLISRETAVVHTTGICDEGDMDSKTAVTTNMVYLSRYAKNLGSQQRIEINQEKRTICDGKEGGTSEECVSEDVFVKDFVPAMKAICDKLEAADDKDLFVKDIKQTLGYRSNRAHKVWTNVCQRLKDAGLVQEYSVIIDNKTFFRLKLLKEFSEKIFRKKQSECGVDDSNVDQANHNPGLISEQLVELPIETQIYDMIDSTGSKGLTLVELCKRLGISNKRYYNTLVNMFSRYGMPCKEEGHKKGMVYRVWTSRNFGTDSLNAHSNKLDATPSVIADDFESQYTTEITCSESLNVTSNDVLPTSADGEHVDVQGRLHSSTGVDYINFTESRDHEGVISYKGDINQQPAAVAKMVVSDIVPYKGYTDQQLAPVDKMVVSDISPSEILPQRNSNSSKLQPHHKDPALTAKRERRILERLQEDKFIIRAELQRWLDSLEKEKHTAMDSKTLNRLLGKLQEQGLCKCCKIGVPFSSNCRRQRTKDVVLHPSIHRVTPEIASQIQERLRFHELECRTRAVNKMRKDVSVPVLDEVHQAPKRIVTDEQTRKSEIMQANGFILSKMIRAKMLHICLWENLSESSDWNDILSSGKPGNDSKNPHSTCKFFVMDDAIKAMPIELFYQVVGSTRKIDEIISTNRSCMCLKDLPVQEYKSLIDSLAMARLSGVFDILRRLVLIRLVSGDGNQEGGQLSLHSNFNFAFELNPYIEEPRATFPTSSNPASLDLRPLIRHDFVLLNRDAVDDYWKTLEYFYSAADPIAAAHAFPGSSVPELFRFRSWLSSQLMTADKRAELLKHIASDDPNKKLSVKECEKIAQDLDVTLQQVLAYKNKVMHRNKNRNKSDLEDMMEEFEHPKCPRSTSRKRKRYPKAKERYVHTQSMDGIVGHEKLTNRSDVFNEFAEDEHVFAAQCEDQGINSMAYLEDHQSEETHQHSFIWEDEHHPFVNQSFHSTRQLRFSWSGEADRQLVIQYARHRAALGPKFHRTDWISLENLPAPPDACRRRMALLKGNPEFGTALMKLLNCLSKRYVKYLKKTKSKLLTDGNQKTVVRDLTSHDLIEHGDDPEERWDDFDCEDIKTALDEVLLHTRMSKKQRVDEGPQKNKKRRMKSCSGKPSRARITGKLVKAISKGGRVNKQAYESLAVSNAVELFKLVFLSTSTATEVPNFMAETLRRYSQHDLFAAFNFLREKKILLGGNGSSFELSQVFLQRFSASPFPADTGERALKFAKWINEKERDLIEEGTDLTSDLECGDILQLFSLVSTGELSLTPCLPDEGVGEPEDPRILKRQTDNGGLCNKGTAKRQKRSLIIDSDLASRREKGFPGIKVSLFRTVFSNASAVGLSPDGENCYEDDKYHREGGGGSECNPFGSEKLIEDSNRRQETRVLSNCSSSPWDTMMEYAVYLSSKSLDQESGEAFHPEIFKDIYEAVKKAGDQGLNLNGISEFVDKRGNPLGEKLAKVAVEVLQAFGLTMQVNAYDAVHIVDSLYQSKYFLTSVTCCAALQRPSRYHVISDVTDSVAHEDQHGASDGTELPLTETGIQNNLAHSVTILDLPAEVPSSLNEKPCTQNDNLLKPRTTSSSSYFPILPWMNGDGTTNKTIYKGLVRRIIGSVMQNPGMLEDDIIRRMDVLNPQSCKKLLELLVLENHLVLRKMRQGKAVQPPSILGCLLRKNFNMSSKEIIWREHFFVNPASSHLL
uniref:B-block binding subunit of TFIIIC domain-containing protein n=1 Tax=Kalanchoe fedtschenkoi TaxID=63787 RepID=A0A7N0V6S9_KALFE